MACHQAKAKRELVRLVRGAEGTVEVDTSGKKSGRGAYLCRAWECWEVGVQGHKLEHAFRTTLTQDNQKQLLQYGKSLTGV